MLFYLILMKDLLGYYCLTFLDKKADVPRGDANYAAFHKKVGI